MSVVKSKAYGSRQGDLAERERDFAAAYAELQNVAEAEKRVGMAPRSGYMMLGRARVQAQIAEYEKGRLAELQSVCSGWALDIMRNPNKPDTIKRDIFKEVGKWFHGGQDAGGVGQREPHEMTSDELAAAIANAEAILSGRARVVAIEDAETVETKPSAFD